MQGFAEELDDEYFRLQGLDEEEGATEAQLAAAFPKASAAAAVVASLGEVTREAVAETPMKRLPPPMIPRIWPALLIQ